MQLAVTTRLERKYGLPAHIMLDPYTEELNGHLYLRSQGSDGLAVLCSTIISITEVAD